MSPELVKMPERFPNSADLYHLHQIDVWFYVN